MKKISDIIFAGTKNLLRWFYKRNPKLFIILLLFFLSAFYFLGILFPIKPIRPYLVDKGITINDLLTRLFQLLAAMATFTSVFVALFRDELRRKFLEVHKVYIDFVEVDKLGEDKLDMEGETDEKKVNKYLCELEFKNLGNIHVMGCEIYIQNIRVKNSINEKPIKRSHSRLEWDNSNQTKTLIPIRGKVYLTAFTILPSQEIMEYDSETNTEKENLKKLPPILKITDNVKFDSNDIKDAEIIIEYLLCFENNQPKEFNLVIKWNGRWESRIPEMKENISINLEFPKNV
jgi:hypothetical protein